MADNSYGNLTLKWILGCNAKTVEFVTDNVISYVCGNHIVFVDVDTRLFVGVFTSPGIGIQAFGTNIVDSLFAFSEVSFKPKIFVYSYPNQEKICELKDAAELEVLRIVFSWEDHVACLSGIPHFKVTIWKWTTAQKICSVALGPQVSPTLVFNPCNWRQLCTIERGMLTVWEILQDEKDYMLAPKYVWLPQSENKKKKEDLNYEGMRLPELGFQPPNKYIQKFQKKDPKMSSEPSGVCWLPSGDVAVCTHDGEVWKLNVEKNEMYLLWLDMDFVREIPGLPPNLQFTCIALHKAGLFVGTSSGHLLKLQVSGMKAKFVTYYTFDSGLNKLRFSINYNSMMIGCANQSVHLLMPGMEEEAAPRMFLAKQNKYIAADILPAPSNYILAIDDNSTVNVIHFETMETVSTLKIPSQCDIIVCSPLWYGAAVGTVDGSVYMLEFCKYPIPRVIDIVRLDSMPVNDIKFDASGYLMYVLLGRSRVFVMSGRPSANFAVLGYTDVTGRVVAMSSWCDKNDADHFVFLTKEGQREAAPGGTVFSHIQLPKTLTGATVTNFTNDTGRFLDGFLVRKSWSATNPCMGLTPDAAENNLYTFVLALKMLMKFSLFPESAEETQPPQVPYHRMSTYSQEMIYPKVEVHRVVKGIHDLQEVTLLSNSSENLIVTYGNDGKLVCRAMDNLDSNTVAFAETFTNVDVGKAVLSKNGKAILMVSKAGYLIMYQWQSQKSEPEVPQTGQKFVTAQKEQNPETVRENMAARLKVSIVVGVALLKAGTVDKPPTPGFLSDGRTKPSSDPSAPHSPYKLSNEILADFPDQGVPWVEARRLQKEASEAALCSDDIGQIKKAVKDLGYQLARVLVENDLLPEGEDINRQEFELDVEMQNTLKEKTELRLQKIRDNTMQNNLMKHCMWDMIRRDCWDTMVTKGRSVQAMLEDMEVFNFALRERSEEDVHVLKAMQLRRQVELFDVKQRQKIGQVEDMPWLYLDSADRSMRMFHLGSQGMLFGGDSRYLYSQFELFTQDQKHCQIVLVQDVIYRIKQQFNKEFDEMHRKKSVAMGKIKERNIRMQQIMDDTSMPGFVWMPSWTKDEKPEQYLVVEDSEVR